MVLVGAMMLTILPLTQSYVEFSVFLLSNFFFFFFSLFFFFTVLLNCLFGHHNHAITLSYRSELAKCVLIEETYELRARAKVKLMYSLGQILISHFTRTLEKNYIKITLNGGIASSPHKMYPNWCDIKGWAVCFA